jgi:hypothetical protein
VADKSPEAEMDALLVVVVGPITMLAGIALAKVALMGLFAMLEREPVDIQP